MWGEVDPKKFRFGGHFLLFLEKICKKVGGSGWKWFKNT
jgi:hypothetical protein